MNRRPPLPPPVAEFPMPVPVPDRSKTLYRPTLIARVILTAEKVSLGDGTMDYSDGDQKAVDEMISFCKKKNIHYELLFEIDDGSF